MASASELLAKEEKLLVCSFCKKQLSDPLTLPCVHRGCYTCISENIKTTSTFVCPSCKYKITVPENGVEGFPKDLFVSSLLKKKCLNSIQNNDVIIRLCKSCRKEKESIAFCHDCDSYLCSSCHQLHLIPITAFLDHSFLSVEENTRQEDNMSNAKPPHCDVHHDQILHISCQTCKGKMLCPACAMLDHRTHDLKRVNEAAKRLMTDVKTKRKMAAKIHPKWKRYSTQVQEWKQNSKNEVLFLTEHANTLFVEKQVSLKNRCESKKSTLTTRIQAEIKILEEELEKGILAADEELKRDSESLQRSKNEILAQFELLTSNYSRFYSTLEYEVAAILDRYDNCDITSALMMKNSTDWSTLVNLPTISAAFDDLQGDLEENHHVIEKMLRNKREPVLTSSEEDFNVGVIEKPSQPGAPEVIKGTRSGITLRWEPAEAPGGYNQFVAYLIEKKVEEQEVWHKMADGIPVPSYTVSHENFEQGEKYRFRVSATFVPDGLYSPVSEESDVLSYPFVPTQPGMPKVIMYGKNDVTLQWSPPDGARDIAYSLQSQDSNGVWHLVDTNLKRTLYTVTGLQGGHVYKFCVSARYCCTSLDGPCSDVTVVTFPFVNAAVLIGTKVVRSSDWDAQYLKNEDRHGVGEVCRQNGNDQSVYVRWFHNNSEGAHYYYMGQKNKYELKLAVDCYK